MRTYRGSMFIVTIGTRAGVQGERATLPAASRALHPGYSATTAPQPRLAESD